MKRISFTLFMLGFGLTLLAQGPRILFIGDSITDGDWGRADGKPSSQRGEDDLNHVFGHGYQALCAYYLQGHWPKKQYKCFNRGISGHTLKDLEARWKEDVLDLHPDVLSVLIGTNDVGRAMSSGEALFDVVAWKALYARLLTEAREANPHIRFILCTPFTEDSGGKGDPSYFKRREWTDICSRTVKELAREFDAPCLEYDAMFDSMIRKYPQLTAKYWIWDSVHPTPAGHQKMADMWLRAFRKLKNL